MRKIVQFFILLLTANVSIIRLSALLPWIPNLTGSGNISYASAAICDPEQDRDSAAIINFL